ncbi:MAG: 2-hydroxyacyl-CoA dehydratase family protein, partial [Chloroflexi bacterium]|nr:2-hydroxyacyl-CoA dehydratase family protein [Chloroflexota bacterium]
MEVTTSILKRAGDKFSSIAVGVKARGGNPEWGWIPELMGGYYATACGAGGKGRPMAWVTFGIASELLWAMDIVPAEIDVTMGVAAGFPEGVTRYIDLAERHVADYICANNKTFIGAILAGDLPKPDIIIQASHPCDSNLATYPVMSEYFGSSYFCIDVPYFRNDAALDYVADELRRLVAFLEEKTGRKLDVDRLKQAMEYSNQAHEYILKLAELRQSVPCPYSSADTVSEYGICLALAGTPQLASYMKKRYEWARDRVSRRQGGLPPGAERIRLVWIYGTPCFDFSIYPWLERTYGAVTVACMNNNFVMKPVEDISDVDHILKGLARKVTDLPMGRECGGVWENYLESQIDLLRRFKADAAIFGGHVACKSNWAIAKLVKDRIRDELGIPTLNMELDVFDPRVATSEHIKAILGDFLEEIPR